jgi:hypothetical protein
MNDNLIIVPKNPPREEPNRAKILFFRVKGESIMILLGAMVLGLILAFFSRIAELPIGATVFLIILPVPFAVMYIKRFKQNKPVYYTDFFVMNILMNGHCLRRADKIKLNPAGNIK